MTNNNKETNDFIKQMKFLSRPTTITRDGTSFIVKWLWRNNTLVMNEKEANNGIMHQYSQTGKLEVEAMLRM